MKSKTIYFLLGVILSAIVCNLIFKTYRPKITKNYNIYTDMSEVDVRMMALGELEKQCGLRK